ncbi:formyltetrahydrofolate deformylase [Desulfovibrio litoralis]|uniref:Formyltetrahydrofolate deformylase n=1 Tax=Desulfovibrio litoralis DSM 11393 TaxID=1121455 RepID=A0A1M7TK43_9BACT|nr:formyltetrahydrofolate deformylase [Desulfovibrio litoralis]SHN71013.1 formyltetrahydrofolate deformylase [Desulfovibrio litoralis DSM 11393]
MLKNTHHVLTISCPDVIGIVASVATFLVDHGANIVDSSQFGDRSTGLFFMRVHFELNPDVCDIKNLQTDFLTLAQRFTMNWDICCVGKKKRVLVMVSRFGHCLNDLLYRFRAGVLNGELVAVVSNHQDFKSLVEWHNIPFFYLPVDKNNKDEQEARLLSLIAEQEIDVVVLARYMQILSEDLCEKLKGRCINIHHSFLPSFKGASPYKQAYERGVKLIGATAHYVTSNLDEGPIIEQGVERVDHSYAPQALEALGKDMECVVLARALTYHLEQRVLINGNKTVVLK